MNQQIDSYPGDVTFGCDPEFFFTKGGKVIGSEKVLSQGGKEIVSPRISSSNLGEKSGEEFSAFVLDGVQCELNPRAHRCRQALGLEIAHAFLRLREHLNKTEGGVTACFAQTINISKKELDSLSESSRQFGCMPSRNLYDMGAKVTVDPAKYLKRSAGGHIHIGLKEYPPLMANRERLIPLMDCLVGLPSVLIDRDPGNKERRKHYGRAGEYRLPDHGIEYRTLSNFWLRSYQLMGFVMGMTKLSLSVLNTTLQPPSYNWDAEGTLLSTIDMEKVVKAINTNDLELAKKIYPSIREFIHTYVSSECAGSFALAGGKGDELTNFDFFIKKIEEQGLDYWFPEDPMDHWCDLTKNKGMDFSRNVSGWETFLSKTVYDRRIKEQVGG